MDLVLGDGMLDGLHNYLRSHGDDGLMWHVTRPHGTSVDKYRTGDERHKIPK